MVDCPCCRQQVPVPPLHDLIRTHGISGQAEIVLRAIWGARGLPVSAARLFDAMYADDPEGGPSPDTMYVELRSAVTDLNETLGALGIDIYQARVRSGWRLRLTPTSDL